MRGPLTHRRSPPATSWRIDELTSRSASRYAALIEFGPDATWSEGCSALCHYPYLRRNFDASRVPETACDDCR